MSLFCLQDVLHGLIDVSNNGHGGHLKGLSHHQIAAELHATAGNDTTSIADTLSGASLASLGKKSTQLAQSVYSGFQSKINKLKEEQQGRDATIVALHKVRTSTASVWSSWG